MSGAARSGPATGRLAGPAPALVVFDCDGVLVDSEPISLAVTLDMLAEAGLPMTPREGYDQLLGRSLTTIATWAEEEHGVTLTQDHLSAMRSRLIARFREELRPVPGVAEAVGALPWPVCVASSSQPDRIRLSLELAGLLPLFEPHIFSASMVSRGKPAPDLFLHAAAQMGAPAEACVVIEDSPAGIAAARAAGMRVIGFTGGAHAGPANLAEAVANSAPDAIISAMADLPACLGTGG
ncbi:HAD family hydrolase [Pseudoroseicyclus tamaricis]|uniref:HAD family hydrolase n=1 Tax=Pseudoroseicyclus tamaricis TaxID=2705421 RepID=A0A6B2K4H9_9RHOB|nr:HAD family hydrolase [Pseudoroseicyclus tamaricis]NDV01596.1 HAD family hydrolase [Pseudoroseicyclus tamaricis]